MSDRVTHRRLADAGCPKCGTVGKMGHHAAEDRYVCGACGADQIEPGRVVWPSKTEVTR